MRQASRTDVLALANSGCPKCSGSGLAPRRDGHKIGLCGPKVGVCWCVGKAVFRICWARWQACAENLGLRCSGAERTRSTRRLGPWGRKNEEYLADFLLLARRTLAPFEYRAFSMYFPAHCSWEDCAKRLGMDRGLFYHLIYRIEATLGETFMLTEPYGLFPLDEYFHATREERAPVTEKEWPKPTRWDRRPIVPPMAATRGTR